MSIICYDNDPFTVYQAVTTLQFTYQTKPSSTVSDLPQKLAICISKKKTLISQDNFDVAIIYLQRAFESVNGT